MLLYGHVYTSDRAELRIVSQTPRVLSLYGGCNSVDSEDRRMIDGISKATIVTYRRIAPLMYLFARATSARCIANRREARKLIDKCCLQHFIARNSIIEFS